MRIFLASILTPEACVPLIISIMYTVRRRTHLIVFFFSSRLSNKPDEAYLNSVTTRTEQSEGSVTKKEEKREKRRKSVHITIRNITYKSRHIPYL